MPVEVFVLGSFAVDCAYHAQRLPAEGETVLGTRFDLGPGGKGSNQAVAAARAGACVALQTAVGRDHFGQIGRDLWQQESIDTTALKEIDTPTGSAAILLEGHSGANRIVMVPGACAELTPEDVQAAAAGVQAAKVFLAQLELPLPVVARGLALARAAGVTTVLNPAPAPGKLPPEILRAVDYLIPNETEAGLLSGTTVDSVASAVEAAKRLQHMGPANIIVTLGDRGAVFLDKAGAVEQVPAFQLGTVVDTTGAGDAFCGAFAAALAVGQEVRAGLRFASAGAALSVLHEGAAMSMARRPQIQAALQQHAPASQA